MDLAKDPRANTTSEDDRRHGERRHADRRATPILGGRRTGEDRRRRERRLKLAGAGLLAAAAFAVGAHEVKARMGWPDSFLTGAEDEGDGPSSSVDVVTDFHLPAWDRASLEPFIQEAAATHGLSPTLIRAVIQTESRFNPLAVSRVGAQGLMQLMPETARHVGIQNPFDPRENILGGTKYLSTLLARFKGNTAKALAAYNAGPTVVARHRGLPPYRETQGYVRKIQKLVDNTDAEFALPATPKVRRASLHRSTPHHVSARKKAVVKAGPARRPAVKKTPARGANRPAVRRAGRRG